MKWFKRTAIAFAALLAIVVALPFFISLDTYIPQIEQDLSARLQNPITIGKIGVSLLPTPHVTIDRITVGKTGDVSLGKVMVTPDLFSLLGSSRVIRAIEIDSLVLTQKGMDRIPVWFTSDSAPQHPPALRVERIRLDNALLTFDKASFGPFDALVNLDNKGDPEDVAIKTQDGKLKATIKPEKSSYMISVNAKSWTLPTGPAIVFDELIATGMATLNGAEFSEVRAKLYGGTVIGNASAGWQKGLQIKGTFDVNQVELKALVPLLAPGNNMSGKLVARQVFSASASDVNKLGSALRLETPFDVKNGILYGVDIQKAATNLIRQGSKGGETRFDALTGHLNLERGSYRFTQMKIASGALSADGNVSISPTKELSGRVNAKVGSGLASAGIPLDVSGTIASPTLLPTKATLAGAAAGTLLLPGVGTGLGMKAGQALEGLFGRKATTKK